MMQKLPLTYNQLTLKPSQEVRSIMWSDKCSLSRYCSLQLSHASRTTVSSCCGDGESLQLSSGKLDREAK